LSRLDLSKLTEAEARELETLLSIEARTSPYSPHEPTDRQRLFLDLPHLEAFYGGSAGGGKSDALLMAGLQYADVPKYSALILRRTFQDLAKPGALLDRSREWLQGSGAQWNDQRKQWRFPSRAVLAFGYLENDADVYQYQSAEYQFVAFDELTQFTARQYTYLFSRLRRLAETDVPIRMRSASNPGGIGADWVYERFIPDDWQPEDAEALRVHEKQGRAFVPARLEDNPFLDQATYERSLAELDEVTRAQLRRGDWRIRPQGNIYKAWTDGPDSHHVITWSQFASVFGERRIPLHWLGACGQDWGFDPDPCATIWNFVAAENSPKVDGVPLSGSIFVPQILTSQGEIPDHVGEKIKLIEAENGWASRIQYRVMSHEASSQQETYRIKSGLAFSKWKPDAHGGIAQMQHALKLRDLDKPHPFKSWLQGRPNYYVIVPDDQMINPKGDEGLAMLRAEFREYKYIEQKVTESKGSNRILPFDHFNHFMDAQRGIAARWFPAAKAMTLHEKVEDRIPEGQRYEDLRERAPFGEGLTPEAELAYVLARQRAKKQVKPAIQRFDEFGRRID
jgi:hypothetical protein